VISFDAVSDLTLIPNMKSDVGVAVLFIECEFPLEISSSKFGSREKVKFVFGGKYCVTL
jgi:hypothetical protein